MIRERVDRFIHILIHKMYYHLLLVLLPTITSELCDRSQYQYYMCKNNTLSCPDDKKCTFVEQCPAVVSLMDQNELPAHR